jgi:hypothetical protein
VPLKSLGAIEHAPFCLWPRLGPKLRRKIGQDIIIRKCENRNVFIHISIKNLKYDASRKFVWRHDIKKLNVAFRICFIITLEICKYETCIVVAISVLSWQLVYSS